METIILGTFLAHFTGIFALAPFCSTSSQLAVSAHNQLSWGTTRRFRNSSTFSRAVVIMISFGGNIVVTHTAIKVTRIPRPRPPAISGDLSGAQFGARCLDCGTRISPQTNRQGTFVTLPRADSVGNWCSVRRS